MFFYSWLRYQFVKANASMLVNAGSGLLRGPCTSRHEPVLMPWVSGPSPDPRLADRCFYVCPCFGLRFATQGMLDFTGLLPEEGSLGAFLQ